MFDTSGNVIRFPDEDREEGSLPGPDTLKRMCLDSASLWVLKRRANLPYMPPQRLPVVARGG